MDKIKKFAMFAGGVALSIIALKMAKKFLPESIGQYLP